MNLVLHQEKTVRFLIGILKKYNIDDFQKIEARFLDACAQIEQINVHKEAYEQQVFCAFVFTLYQGVEANRENFKNPVFGSFFLKCDPEVYTKENTVYGLPLFQKASQTLRENRIKNERLFEAISDYYMYLLMHAMRLGHYFGFMWADQLLPLTEPGYALDFTLSLCYQDRMKEWYGTDFKEELMK